MGICLSILQAAAAGDSGAPLLNIAKENEETKERLGETLLAIHSGGDSAFVATRVTGSRRKIYPQWWIRVRLKSNPINLA